MKKADVMGYTNVDDENEEDRMSPSRRDSVENEDHTVFKSEAERSINRHVDKSNAHNERIADTNTNNYSGDYNYHGNYYENSQDSYDSNQDDAEDDSSDSFSDTASFPTQEDLESIIVHPPESIGHGSVPDEVENRSVSSIEYGISASRSFRSLGSTGSIKEKNYSSVGGGSGSIGGGCNSVGGLSEKSETKSSVADCEDQSAGKVMITTFPNGITYAASVKSDQATVCSGSVVEDIDMVSLGTAHSGNTGQFTQNSLSGEKQAKKKHERGVEFVSETSTMWAQSIYHSYPVNKNVQQSPLFRNSPVQGAVLGSLAAASITLNDMGPPLKRPLFERFGSTGLSSLATSLAGSMRSYASSTGTASRAGSVRSFGSQAASEVVHVDTDDCGGSIVESDEHRSASGVDETPPKENFQVAETLTLSTTEVTYSINKTTSPCKQDDQVAETSLATLNDRLSDNHGRISPGGTVYKGRGVRRYQGRYMHLPLQRFHCSINVHFPVEGTVIGQEIKRAESVAYKQDTQDHSWDRSRSWSKSRSRSRSRSQSRSRSRSRSRNFYRRNDKNRSCNKRAWSRSRSPNNRRNQGPNQYSDRNYRSNCKRRSNRQYTQQHREYSGPRRRNTYRRNNGNYTRNRRSGNVRSNPLDMAMTPRDPRHQKSNWM